MFQAGMKRLDGKKRNEEEKTEEENENKEKYATALGFGRKTPKSSPAITVVFSLSIVVLI